MMNCKLFSRRWHRALRNSTAALVMMAVLLSTGCSKDEPTKPLDAAETALQSYEALYDGNCEEFLKARANYDEMPENYREALLTCYQQHVAEVNQQHGGVTKVEATRTQNDTVNNVVQVFMMVSYNDSTQEEIVVPVVKVKDEWKLK